jgi:hypothetical protein
MALYGTKPYSMYIESCKKFSICSQGFKNEFLVIIWVRNQFFEYIMLIFWELESFVNCWLAHSYSFIITCPSFVHRSSSRDHRSSIVRPHVSIVRPSFVLTCPSFVHRSSFMPSQSFINFRVLSKTLSSRIIIHKQFNLTAELLVISFTHIKKVRRKTKVKSIPRPNSIQQ